MKEELLRRAIGEIDERLIEDAANAKRKKPWIRWIAAAAAVVLILTALLTVPRLLPRTDPAELRKIAETERYTLYAQSGQSFLVWKEAPVPEVTPEGAMISVMAPYLEFASVRQMRQALTDGTLTEEQMKWLALFPVDEQGRVKLGCDPDNLYDWNGANGWTAQSVTLYADRYYFELRSEAGHGQLSILPRERWESQYRYEKDDKLNDSGIAIESRTETNDRHAVQIEYTTSVARVRRVEYTLTRGNKTLHVFETYRLSIKSGMEETSDTVPRKIKLFVDQGDVCIRATLFGLPDRPSVAWLKAFGVKKT